MVRHPNPKTSTVKELYGSASTCAYPTCDEPLYRFVEELGESALNSVVAHICAASPGGPRFDPEMSPEDNRASANLILLCKFHADLIDTQAESYPKETLQLWKRNQEATGQGTSISDDQAREAIEFSQRNEIRLEAEVINVGGQWGGGGGAIGAGAVGGPGGDTVILRLDAQGPGSGGGTVVGKTDPPVDASRAKQGRAYVPGFDGGDSSFGSPGMPGSVTARGGGAAGFALKDRKTTSFLGASALLFFNAAEVQGGLVSMLGGAWESLSVLNVPTQLSVGVLVVLEAGGVDQGAYSVHLRFTLSLIHI